jgi:hypothetical protein
MWVRDELSSEYELETSWEDTEDLESMSWNTMGGAQKKSAYGSIGGE